ncbi:MAG: putative quinol monooxygenase [Opitutales bacterium]
MKVEGHIQFPQGANLQIIKLALDKHIELTRAEPGCILFEVTAHSEIRGRFNVKEEFESKEAFELHQERTQKSEWAEVSNNGLRHYTIHEV